MPVSLSPLFLKLGGANRASESYMEDEKEKECNKFINKCNLLFNHF